jgi:2-polyprenyl-6-hydroxyphenyl methylase/3-demethylubiquinone-9 3-methyltransferase
MAEPDRIGTASAPTFESEVARGERFRFGRNWGRFSKVIDDHRIEEAEKSLRTMLAVEDLEGRTFLDVGSGSGLFSLAARRLRATVHSFDFDPDSVACTRELRRRYRGDDPAWRIEQASVLDRDYLVKLGRFDVVYAWGVLHHTGAMWTAIDNVVGLVAPQGRLFIALYNDQGKTSVRWRKVKKLYCSGALGRTAVLATLLPYYLGRSFLADLVHLKDPFARHRDYRRRRGMSYVYDWIDWFGGFPFEVATVDAVRDFCVQRGLALDRVERSTGHACNEFVFTLATTST